ncbi:MAG TPA: hypothetical protein VMF86_17625 [Stellaceae bacterium]|nr:hypothetical protein [Stellaceae bacterium]
MEQSNKRRQRKPFGSTQAAMIVALCVGALALPAAAQEHHEHGYRGGFHGHPLGRWRGGHWHHGWHGGRYGWWWIAPGFDWAFYPAPIYPYPELPAPYVAPPAYAAGPPPPAPATWYYCGNPAGYYPYVQRCLMPWRPVPAH